MNKSCSGLFLFSLPADTYAEEVKKSFLFAAKEPHLHFAFSLWRTGHRFDLYTEATPPITHITQPN